MGAKRYITIPKEVSAIKFEKASMGDFVDFCGGKDFSMGTKGGVVNLQITLTNGARLCVIEGDWAIKDESGISIMKARDFCARYIEKK